MKKFLIVFLFASQLAFAALSPFYQGVREMEAILKDPRLAELFGEHERIVALFWDEADYWVEGEDSWCRVKVNYLPKEHVGPAAFELEFYTPDCP